MTDERYENLLEELILALDHKNKGQLKELF